MPKQRLIRPAIIGNDVAIAGVHTIMEQLDRVGNGRKGKSGHDPLRGGGKLVIIGAVLFNQPGSPAHFFQVTIA